MKIKQEVVKEKKKVHVRGKTGSLKKNKEELLRRQLKEAKAEIARLKDRYLRTVAEMDNFRKRTEREMSRIIRSADEQIIKDILPVVDDLERSLKRSNKKGTSKEFHTGVSLIYQKMSAIFQNYGLEPMESEGKPFDVNLHDALLQIKKKGVPPGIVVEEQERGYLLHDRVLRHAKVIVSK